MSGGGYEPSNPIDLYLDGIMSDAERRRFDARLEQEHLLRAAMELQRKIDGALQRLASPPDALPILARVPRMNHSNSAAAELSPTPPAAGRNAHPAALATAPAPVPSRWRPRPALAAAALLFLALGLWGAWELWRSGSPDYPALPWRSMEMVYRIEVQRGFQPLWVCRTEEEFADAYRRNLRQPLLLSTPPPGVEAVGLSYTNTLSANTVYLLGRAQNQPVIIFADRLENDSPQQLSRESGLKLFRRELGPLVLYEVTPLDRPHLLDLFYPPP